eukprot:5851961-Pleurochrysis_carterae.AAC.8
MPPRRASSMGAHTRLQLLLAGTKLLLRRPYSPHSHGPERCVAEQFEVSVITVLSWYQGRSHLA